MARLAVSANDIRIDVEDAGADDPSRGCEVDEARERERAPADVRAGDLDDLYVADQEEDY
jgi:hypothetical protein